MALIVADRVQELTTTSGTGTLTLSGAVNGFQTFSTGIGNGNTTFYTIYDPTAYAWEVGIGTVGSGTLSRDTVLANSSGTTAKINLAGNQTNVFCTYPAGKSVNLDSSGNVTPLGTISSGTWQGSTIGVGYGGTGVTSSSGANSVVLRDSNQNIVANKISQSVANITATGGTTSLTASSAFWQTLTGTTTHTIKLPDATTLPIGFWYIFDNDSTGSLTIQDFASSSLDTIAPGGYTLFYLDDNSTVAGGWNRAGLIPAEVNWGTNNLDLGGLTTITNGAWQGDPVGSAYGGTGLTTFTAANYALYSTSASALTAGTLPVVAGGTGNTTYTDGQLLIGNSTGNTLTKATLTAGSGISITNGNGSISIAATGSGDVVGPASATDNAIARFDGTTGKIIQNSAVTIADTTGSIDISGSSARITATFSNTASTNTYLQNRVTNSSTIVTAIPNGTGTTAGFEVHNTPSFPDFSYGGIYAGTSTVFIASHAVGTGTVLPMTFNIGGSEQLRITTNGGISFGISGTAYGTSGQVLQSNGNAPPSWVTLTASGDVTGPASATDNAIARFDGTTGKLIQNSAVTIDDTTGTMRFGSGANIIAPFNGLNTSTDTFFQNSASNTNTYISTLPNGTATTSGMYSWNNSSTTNASVVFFGISNTVAAIESSKLGTGTFLPLVFRTGSDTRMSITANGGVAFGTSATNYGTSGQVLQSNGDAPPSWATLSAPSTYNTLIGNGSSTTITVTHNLNKSNIIVSVREESSGDFVYPQITYTSTNAFTVTFVTAPASNFYRVAVVGF